MRFKEGGAALFPIRVHIGIEGAEFLGRKGLRIVQAFAGKVRHVWGKMK
ncbi:MAG: hypothetical protein NTZ78_07685 [Candidatus Aureabacteria bacterium]|nr:hypothetical protein [Candidatus Auribacterota bacterium]